MSNQKECKCKEIKDYKSAFECFKQRFLRERQSIFNLEGKADDALTTPGVEYLMDNFINNGYTGNASFLEKIKSQLIDNPIKKAETKIVKEAIEILATAVWLWRLPPANSSISGKKNSVKEILDLHSESNNIVEGNKFFTGFKGFATTGTYYNVNKPTELAYIIKFFEEYIKDENKDTLPIDILNIDALKGRMKIETKMDYSWTEKETNLKLTKFKDNTHDNTRTVSIHNALLHLFDSDNYEPILSNKHKDKIKKVFSKIFNIEIDDTDKVISEIKIKIKNKGLKFDSFYDDNIKNIWQGGLDFESKNIILHGAPGTGKTYLTEETVKARKLIEEKKSEYELVQFHPSYSYEDFIEGIKPTKIIKKSGQMKFELKNGQFKQMCINAFDELNRANNDESYVAKTFYFIADEINRAELSRVFGELLLCIEDDKRLRFDGDKVVGTKVKTPNSNLWKKKHAVVTLDENDKISETGNKYFGVPENIYFIGTMNDIDRSVDSFDMALRRRFVWKHYKCEYDVILEKYNEIDEKLIESYIEICKKVNLFITSEKDNGLSLGTSYEIGHSYFMKPKMINQTQLNNLWRENLSPLIKEYLRSEYSENELEKHLKKAKKIFNLPKTVKSTK